MPQVVVIARACALDERNIARLGGGNFTIKIDPQLLTFSQA